MLSSEAAVYYWGAAGKFSNPLVLPHLSRTGNHTFTSIFTNDNATITQHRSSYITALREYLARRFVTRIPVT